MLKKIDATGLTDGSDITCQSGGDCSVTVKTNSGTYFATTKPDAPPPETPDADGDGEKEDNDSSIINLISTLVALAFGELI